MEPVIEKPIPTNVITGFLGVGKTTAIQHLLQQKPQSERWAVLVNEFGEIGIDGGLFAGNAGDEEQVFIKEVPGGCMCCVSGLPMQVALNLLISEAKPDRLIIEPTGLGHPKEVLNTFTTEYYRTIIDLKATLTLVDARKVNEDKYRNHETFRQQISVADRVIASKADLYEGDELRDLQAFLEKLGKGQTQVNPIENGQVDLQWLNDDSGFMESESGSAQEAASNESVQSKEVVFRGFFDLPVPDEGFSTKGAQFSPEKVFEFEALYSLLTGIEVERLKAIFITQKGIFAFNKVDDVLSVAALDEAIDSRIELIFSDSLDFDEIEAELNRMIS